MRWRQDQRVLLGDLRLYNTRVPQHAISLLSLFIYHSLSFSLSLTVPNDRFTSLLKAIFIFIRIADVTLYENGAIN